MGKYLLIKKCEIKKNVKSTIPTQWTHPESTEKVLMLGNAACFALVLMGFEYSIGVWQLTVLELDQNTTSSFEN